MGVPVIGFDDFEQKLERVRRRSVIFGFLVYDSRPSQKSIARFAREQADWIDEMARGAGIYFFFPFRKEGELFENPSPEVMRAFGLGLSRSPGVILFAPPHPDGTIRTEHAVYLPLEKKDFGDPEIYEPVMDDLFRLVGACLEEATGSHDALARISARIKSLRRRRTGRGFARLLRKGGHAALFKVPPALYSPIAEGAGKAVVDLAARS